GAPRYNGIAERAAPTPAVRRRAPRPAPAVRAPDTAAGRQVMTTDVSSARAGTGAPGRTGRVPKYYRIKQRLLQMTDERTPGAPMPAERLLAVEFRTSRTTVRKALQELVSEGRLDRIQGKGTFVWTVRRTSAGWTPWPRCTAGSAGSTPSSRTP